MDLKSTSSNFEASALAAVKQFFRYFNEKDASAFLNSYTQIELLMNQGIVPVYPPHYTSLTAHSFLLASVLHVLESENAL